MIQTSCPQCLTGYKLPDAQAGKKVRCKSCEATFLVERPEDDVPVLEEATPEDLRKSRPAPRDDVDELPVLEEAPRTRPAPPPRGRSRDDEDDDERPVRRRRTPEDDEEERPRSGGNAVLIIGLIAAGLLLVGGGGGLLWYLSTQGGGDQGGAPKPPDNPNPVGGGAIGNPGGGMIGNPGGGAIGVPGGAIGVPGGAIGTPKDGSRPKDDRGKDGGISIPNPVRQPPKNVTEALDALKSGDSQRISEGLNFLRNNSKEQGRRDEVGRALSPFLRDQKTAAEAAAAAANWPSKEVLGDLIDLAEGEAQVPYLNAIHALGKYDDEKAFAALAKLLVPLFKSAPAADALRLVGKKAEKQVVPYLHHKEGHARKAAQQLLEGYGTAEPLLLEQTLKDLTSTEAGTKQSAAEWLAKKRPGPDRKEQHETASRALEALLKDENGQVKQAAVDALVNWATPANIEAIHEAAINDFFINKKKVVSALSQLKDEKAALALAAIYVKHAGERKEAGQALLALGPLAVKGGWVLANQKDVGMKMEGVRLLAEVGTAETIKDLTKFRSSPLARGVNPALINAAIAKIKARTIK